jgi:DNA primase
MEIAEVKSKLSIGEVLDHYGLQPNRNPPKGGQAFMLNCPFHPDKNPSMQVYPETNTVHCFSGNCEHTGKAIDQIDFILHKEGCSKHEAITKAKKLLGESIPPKGRTGIQTVNQKHQPMNLTEIFKQLQQSLPKSKKAIEYLESRNLEVKEIGYNSGTSYKSLKNCIVFPLKDQKGEIISLYGRSINGDGHFYLKDRSGLYPGYLNPETTVTGSPAAVILTESIIDSATIAKFTNYQTLALYGTNGFTTEHSEALSQIKNLQEVILFLDGDEAGRKAVEKYAQHLHELLPNVQISKVETPENEDPNSLVQSHPPEVGQASPNILNHLIENRTVVFSSSEKNERGEMSAGQRGLDTKNPDYITFTKIPLLISVMGGIGLHPLDKLIVTLRIERTDSNSPLHSLRHRLDLYNDDQVEKLTRKTAERLELGSREVQIMIAELITALENHREEQILKSRPLKPTKRLIPPDREKAAISFMKRKDYLKQLYELIQKSGVVGERNNSLVLWITYATRKRHDPLHVICLGASGTGKTYLQEKISDLVPEEDKVSGTAISENALYYAQDINLKNKLFIIEDLDGASNILYALRELQTKKIITKMVTQKDSKGNLKTEIVTVHGPICLTATTTKERLYEDNANRCLLIYLDGSKEQQEAIMDDQRRRSAGRINKKEQAEVKDLLRDMQALYKPIEVRNPFAEQLKIPETVFKPLRTNSHYLAFIEGITFCNQFQRSVSTDRQTGELFIQTTIEDIELANELMKDVLLSKSDELTKACRGFFETLKSWLNRERKQSFYSRELRQAYRMAPTTVNRHLYDLMRYGYVKVIGGNRAKGYEYELDDREEYNHLKNSIQNALDEALQRIKNQKQ